MRGSLGLKISAALLHRVVELTQRVSHLPGRNKTSTAASHDHTSSSLHPSATVSMHDVNSEIHFAAHEWTSHQRAVPAPRAITNRHTSRVLHLQQDLFVN